VLNVEKMTIKDGVGPGYGVRVLHDITHSNVFQNHQSSEVAVIDLTFGTRLPLKNFDFLVEELVDNTSRSDDP
jgi:hypothetical protein